MKESNSKRVTRWRDVTFIQFAINTVFIGLSIVSQLF
jgi:hypothetical protein